MDATSKYTSIDEVVGQIYKLCKDQHGCRFLQKQLEEGNANVVQVVFNEVYDHIVELMTGFLFVYFQSFKAIILFITTIF